MAGAAIGQIVPVDRGEHHVPQLHQLYRTRRVVGLLGIQPAAGIAGIDGAKATGPGTDIPHQHDSGRARTPALAHIRAFGLFADGGQAVLMHNALDFFVGGAAAHPHPQPVRLGQAELVAPARLDAVLDRDNAPVVDKFLAAGDLNQRDEICVWHTL